MEVIRMAVRRIEVIKLEVIKWPGSAAPPTSHGRKI